MSNYNQQFSAGEGSYAMPKSVDVPPMPSQAPYVVAPPPPMGYPVKDDESSSGQNRPVETRSRGDGFWKGCCAGLCCCCALDCCL